MIYKHIFERYNKLSVGQNILLEFFFDLLLFTLFEYK